MDACSAESSLNLIQMELARSGIYYKGDPTDNTFDQQKIDWDQAAYPQSPLRFYRDHVEGWLPEEIAAAKN